MRGLAGYNFKDGKLNDLQRQTLNEQSLTLENIEGFDLAKEDACEWTVGNRTYLMRPKKAALSIFGVGPDNQDKSDGIVWGTSENSVLQGLYHIQLMDIAYPYKVEENAVYIVEDGDVHILYRKGDRVATPEGPGTIFSIDDLHDICVDLEQDGDVLYEFIVTELSFVKKDK